MIKPIGFTKKGNEYTYHYEYSFLKEFIIRGRGGKQGYLLLTESNGVFFKYKFFNRNGKLFSITAPHLVKFDGPLLEGQDYIDSLSEKTFTL